MKELVIILLLTLSINETRSQEIVIDNYTFENGVVENRVYTCNKFDWKIAFPAGTSVMTLDRIDELEKKGYDAVKKEVPKGMQIKKSVPHLIGFSFSKYNYLSASFENLHGTKKVTLKEHQEFMSKILDDTYSKIEQLKAIHSVRFEEIGPYNFYTIETKLFDKKNNRLLLTQLLYNSFIDNNLFSVSINYNDAGYGKILDNSFRDSLSK